MAQPKVIITCFAGRQRNLEIMLKHIEKLYNSGSMYEFHMWNFTRNADDELWINTTFPGARSNTNEQLEIASYSYIPTAHTIRCDGGQVPIRFKGAHDAHIGLFDDTDTCVAEVCLGGWGNSMSVIRKTEQGDNVETFAGLICNPFEFVEVVLQIENGILKVVHNHKIILKLPLESRDSPLKIKVAAWEANVTWDLRAAPDPSYVKVFNVANKQSWLEYYSHYTPERYPNHVIIKCDDDVVFIDTETFDAFIERRIQNTDGLLAFPSIINNGVCAYHQQQLGIIPETLDTFPYDTLNGKLWENGLLCQRLHEYFLDNTDEWLQKARTMTVDKILHPIGDRISINFFAILSQDLHYFQEIGSDDEFELSINLAKKTQRHHYIDTHFTVSHLAFHRQRETGLDEALMLSRYAVKI